MKKNEYEIYLALILTVSIFSVLFIEKYSVKTEKRSDADKMMKASVLAQKWFDIVCTKKLNLGIKPITESGEIINAGLIGEDFNFLTTTIGSLEAKKITLNPDFAALIYKWLKDANIDSTKTVGIACSASFPALVISALAAVNIIGAKVVLVSSLGSSMYGANDSLATWLDMESWLRETGELDAHSELVTFGGDYDKGIGYSEEGINIIKEAAIRNKVGLYIPETLDQAIKKKEELFLNKKISLFINIGGNHSSLGNCRHAISIPNGFNPKIRTCSDSDRGLVYRLAEKGIQIIHLLNIKELALKNGMDIYPGKNYIIGSQIYYQIQYNKLISLTFLFIITGLLFFIRYKKKLITK